MSGVGAIATTHLPHPLAELVPAMTDEEYARLREDIATNGLEDAITLYEDKILDGRHRYRACLEENVEPRFATYEGVSPAQFVISHNLHRRHLSLSQLGMIATDFLPYLEIEAKNRQGRRSDLDPTLPDMSGKVRGLTSASRAGATFGVSRQQVERAKRVQKEDPILAQKVRNGALTLNAAYRKVAPTTQAYEEKRRCSRPPELQGTPHPVATRDDLSPRNALIAQKIQERIQKALATLSGLTDGLSSISLVNVHLVTEPNEIEHWEAELIKAIKNLQKFRRLLKETQQ